MMIVLSYDVDTTDAAGSQTALQSCEGFVKQKVQGTKILSLSYWLIRHS